MRAERDVAGPSSGEVLISEDEVDR